jgi:DNA-binding IclR family transcriptional regulator
VSRDAGGENPLVGSDRVLAVLVQLARRPDGASLDELARAVSSPKSTVHRALGSLVRSGLAARTAFGHYVLGDEFLRLAFTHHEARPDHVRIRPVLRALAERYGETAHYAVLDGAEVVYRAKVDPPGGAVRLSSVIGGRNPAHCTAVGKLLLAHELPDDAAAAAWARARQLTARTPNTVTAPDAFAAELRRIREQGFGLDREENELGVTCLAVPAFLTSPVRPSGAVSISALAYRTPLDRLVADAAVIAGLVTGEQT